MALGPSNANIRPGPGLVYAVARYAMAGINALTPPIVTAAENRALLAAGYTRAPLGRALLYRPPGGGLVTPGRGLSQIAASQYPEISGDFSPVTPGQPGRAYPEPQAPATRPAPPAPPRTPPINPNAPPPPPPGMPIMFGNLWSMLTAYAIAYALPILVKKASESWEQYFKRWTDREAKHRAAGQPRGPRSRGRKPKQPPKPKAPPKEPGRGDPFPQQPPVTVIIKMPEQPRAPARRPNPSAGLYVPKIYRQRLPVPTPPPPPKPLWQQLLVPGLGLVTPLLSRTKKGKQRISVNTFVDPLTAGNAAALTYGSTLTGSGYAWQPPAQSGQTCECKATGKKRGKRKRRTVCYSGTYTERSSGLTKRKARKVPCK